jgi:long-chain acyl-CoA synthetase
MLAHHFLEESAQRTPSRTALASNDLRLTYADIDQAANRLARSLQRHGLQRGERVAIFLKPGASAVIGLFAALKAGGAFMVVHPSTRPEKLAELFADAEPTALVTDAAHMRDSLPFLDAGSYPELIVWADNTPPPSLVGARALTWSTTQAEPAEPPPCLACPDDLAALIYTSGTTGKAKAVMLSHANMRAATRSVTRYLELTDRDVILSGLPLAFSYGLYQIFESFHVGGRLVLEDGYAFPARTVQLLRDESVTGVPGVPTVFALLLRQPKLLEGDFPALRYLTNAGGPLPVKHLQQLRQYFPRVKFFSMYGQTECKRASRIFRRNN